MVLNMLLVHQTSGGIAQRQETVIVGVHAVAVARERVHEQLQLVVGSLADMHAHATKGVLQMVGALLNILVDGQRHHDVEVGIDELLVFSGNHILHLLDVLDGNQVAGVGHAGMAVLLFVEQGELPLLVRHEYHLVVDDSLSQGNVVHKRHKVNRHRGVVDLNAGVGTDDSREVHAVNIDKAIDLAALVAHADTFVVNLEVGHRDNPVGEVHREIAVDIDSGSCPVKISGVNAAVLQLVFHLANLH